MIELEIEYSDTTNNFYRLKLNPEQSIPDEIIPSHSSTFSVPIYFNPSETKSGWIAYKIPKRLIHDHVIEGYKLKSITSSDQILINETFIVNRINTDE